jgi:hypothetical protein
MRTLGGKRTIAASILIGTPLVIGWMIAVGTYEDAIHPDDEGFTGGLMASLVLFLGVLAFFVVFPLISATVAARESQVPRWKKHSIVLLGLLVMFGLIARMMGNNYWDDLRFSVVLFFAPLAVGWLVLSEALDWLRMKGPP